ncbi:MAG TPA: hypothetical protein ENK23_04505 [Sorangium sp.]|nr:hypothetical protein [Sorangium sp.]
MSEDTLLTRLATHTALVPETAELATVQKYRARHVNLAASQITAAAQLPAHEPIVDAAIAWAANKVGTGGNRRLVAIRAVERLAIEFAHAASGIVAGDISIEVDGRLAYKRRQLIDRARTLMDQLLAAGLEKERLLLRIPATWEGLQAIEKLHAKNGIRCHATLVFGMHQLAAAADAGAAVIAPAVGRITDWHKKRDGVEDYPSDSDPGVLRTLRMLDYLSDHHYDAVLMPGCFRHPRQALALARCQRISLPAKWLSDLSDLSDEHPALAAALGTKPTGSQQKLTIDSAAFHRLTSADEVTNNKLTSGVKNLSWAMVAQEKQLVDWITGRQDSAAERSTAALFRTWDYDGDGYIDREEWSGTDAVFNALDRDNNGRISLEEMAAGLGAPYTPDD